MKSLKDVIRKVIANKHLGKDMIGAITLNVIRDYFSPKSKVKNLMTLRPYDLKTVWQTNVKSRGTSNSTRYLLKHPTRE